MRDVFLITPDINVYVSGAIISQSPSSQIMQLWREREIDIAVSPPILERMAQVFNYPKVRKLTGWSDTEIQGFFDDIRALAIMSPGILQVDATSDPEDNTIFACAIEAQADYIVSGDEKHVQPVGIYQSIPVVSPRAFLTLFQEIQAAAA